MQVYEAIELKAQVEQDIVDYINKLLTNYELKTGLRPYSVDVGMMHDEGEKQAISCDVSVNL